MKLAFYMGDTIQSYEMGLINEFCSITRAKGYRLDILANCCVPSGDFLHIEGLKKVFYLSDLKKYDGIIVADDTLHNYDMNVDLRKLLKEEAKCPVVCLRNPVEGFYNIVFDDSYEIYKMTQHLQKKHGCKDIGFVTGTFELDDSFKRLEGYKTAMFDAGLEVNDEEDIFNGNYWSNQGDETADFFMNRKKGLPEAIVCSNDYMAIALIDSLKKRGIKCPEDILITGLDNIPEGNENIPMLTTIDFNQKEMAEKAISLIEDLNSSKTVKSKKILINGKGVYRCSCGCVNVNEVLLQNYKMMRDIISEEYSNAIQCVNMNMDFGGILGFEDCVKRALQLLRNTHKFKRIYAILRNTLYAEVTPEEKVVILDNTSEDSMVSTMYPISKIRDDILNEESNVFFPINYQDELYGYMVLQLKDGVEKYFDVVTAQLLIMLGNTLKKLELLSYQGELRDIKRLYQQDPLTELYNRRGFENHIKMLYHSELISDKSLRVVIASIDVDELKYINDNFGHYEGDRAIKAVADCLKECLEKHEFAARIGGDEFSAILLYHEGESIDRFRNKLYESINKAASKFPKYTFSVSVGLAEVKSHMHFLESMKEADSDMYKEKQLHHKISEK
ncbi:MAG: GGDEF domain-containing protein [Eubacterium sp.]|nr:GGDEF domain-containing protein [Eubacterium sp.]